VTRGRLRRDLVYRLAVFPIEVPPLRTRGLDAIELAERFLAQLNHQNRTRRKFCQSSYDFILGYDWPGNVRELRNCVERAYILSSGNEVALVSPMQLPVEAEVQDQGECVRLSIGTRLVDAERQLILATLDHFAGDKRRTADALGCSLKTIYNKLNHYRQCERSPAAEPSLTH
jgi:DNA-binding NtrC family response regulator